MTTNDLWHEVEVDQEAAALERAVRQARGALSKKVSFLMEASSREAFEDRLALIDGDIDAAVRTAAGDGAAYALARTRVVDDFHDMFRRGEANRRRDAAARHAREARKLRPVVDESVLAAKRAIRTAATQAEVDTWLEKQDPKFAEWARPYAQRMVYGANYNRSIATNLPEAARAFQRANGDMQDRQFRYVRSQLDAALGSERGEAWYWDEAQGEYTQRLDGTMAKRAAYYVVLREGTGDPVEGPFDTEDEAKDALNNYPDEYMVATSEQLGKESAKIIDVDTDEEMGGTLFHTDKGTFELIYFAETPREKAETDKFYAENPDVEPYYWYADFPGQRPPHRYRIIGPQGEEFATFSASGNEVWSPFDDAYDQARRIIEREARILRTAKIRGKRAGSNDDFWAVIDHQLEALKSAKSAADVARILGGGAGEGEYPGAGGTIGFFAGSGGDGSPYYSLMDAGWKTVAYDADYYWAMQAPNGDVISYVEGDIYSGNQLVKGSARKTAGRKLVDVTDDQVRKFIAAADAIGYTIDADEAHDILLMNGGYKAAMDSAGVWGDRYQEVNAEGGIDVDAHAGGISMLIETTDPSSWFYSSDWDAEYKEPQASDYDALIPKLRRQKNRESAERYKGYALEHEKTGRKLGGAKYVRTDEWNVSYEGPPSGSEYARSLPQVWTLRVFKFESPTDRTPIRHPDDGKTFPTFEEAQEYAASVGLLIPYVSAYSRKQAMPDQYGMTPEEIDSMWNAQYWAGAAEQARRQEEAKKRLWAWKGQEVTVVKGRKIPIGTTGIVFYSGEGQWGWRIGFKTADGQELWTDLKNVELTSELSSTARRMPLLWKTIDGITTTEVAGFAMTAVRAPIGAEWAITSPDGTVEFVTGKARDIDSAKTAMEAKVADIFGQDPDMVQNAPKKKVKPGDEDTDAEDEEEDEEDTDVVEDDAEGAVPEEGIVEDQVEAVDPLTLDVGDTVTVSYTMATGETGEVEGVFVRNENDIAFFSGPNGEFGVAERDGAWIDSEGNQFTFTYGSPDETGEQVQTQESEQPSDQAPPGKSNEGDGDKGDDAEKEEKGKGDDKPPWLKGKGSTMTGTLTLNPNTYTYTSSTPGVSTTTASVFWQPKAPITSMAELVTAIGALSPDLPPEQVFELAKQAIAASRERPKE